MNVVGDSDLLLLSQGQPSVKTSFGFIKFLVSLTLFGLKACMPRKVIKWINKIQHEVGCFQQHNCNFLDTFDNNHDKWHRRGKTHTCALGVEFFDALVQVQRPVSEVVPFLRGVPARSHPHLGLSRLPLHLLRLLRWPNTISVLTLPTAGLESLPISSYRTWRHLTGRLCTILQELCKHSSEILEE